MPGSVKQVRQKPYICSPRAGSCMVQKKWLLASVLAASLFLAGCTTTDAVDPDSMDDEETPDGSGGEVAWSEATGHAFTTEPAANTSLREEGSFTLADYCLVVACLADAMLGTDQYGHTTDISEHVPEGVPTLVEAEMRFDDNGIYNLTIGAPGSEIYWVDYGSEEGVLQATAMVLRSDSDSAVEIIITAAFPLPFSDPQTEFQWTLQTEISTHPQSIPAGAIVSVPVSEGTKALNFTALDGTAEWILWDGADAQLARNETAGTLHFMIPDDAAREDDFVLYLLPGSSPLQLNATGPGPVSGLLERLALTWAPVGDPEALESGENTTWSYDLDRVPIAAGVGIDFDEVVDNGDAQIRVSSPQGTILDAQTGCYFCTGFEFRAQSEAGDADHVLGTYTVDATTTFGVTLEVQAYSIIYER